MGYKYGIHMGCAHPKLKWLMTIWYKSHTRVSDIIFIYIY